MANDSPSLQSLPPFALTSRSRLQALYSDISRQKSTNPASFQSNVEWWHSALQSLILSGKQQNDSKMILSAGQSLIEQLRFSGVGKPLGLGAIVAELRSKKTLVDHATFLNSTASIYDPGRLPTRVAAYVIGKPLWWALEQLGIVGEEGIIGTSRAGNEADKSWWGDYISISLLEKGASTLLKIQGEKSTNLSDQIYDFEGFKKTFGCALGAEGKPLSDKDALVLLKYLERDKRVLVVDQEVIKFVQLTSSVDEQKVTTVDRGILELKVAVSNLASQINRLQEKIDDCTSKASSALQLKQKEVALNYIRSRRHFSDVLSKRLGSMHNLETTLLSMESAAGDIEIMKAYATSTTTLQTILSHPLLQQDAIDETLSAMSDANAEAKDLDEMIRIMVPNSEDEEDSVQNELDDILAELAATKEPLATADEIRLKDLYGLNTPKILPEDGGKKIERILQT